ncbi:MAG TPA: fibronectin type III domain-containing protein [Verrucomicrobiae bacterium]|nr:fibronectin type III domain-containing protein [Verrucomicrobiae bacterium]
MIAFKLSTQETQDQVAALRTIKANDIAIVGGRAAANLLRQHLFDLDGSHANAMGGRRTHFFADGARSVQNPAVSGGLASVVVNHVGLAQRWLGGTIRAGAGTSSATGSATKYLAIPARAEAYGRRPGEFHDLVFEKTKTGGMLVQALQTVLTRAQGGFKTRQTGGLVMYWLKTEVEQEPEPDVMPSEQEFGAAVGEAVGSFVARKLATAAAALVMIFGVLSARAASHRPPGTRELPGTSTNLPIAEPPVRPDQVWQKPTTNVPGVKPVATGWRPPAPLTNPPPPPPPPPPITNPPPPITNSGPASVMLGWNHSAGSGVGGYNIYYGPASGTYTNMVSVGYVTNGVVTNLLRGARYYFAATSLSTNGLESVYSNEVNYTPPEQ